MKKLLKKNALLLLAVTMFITSFSAYATDGEKKERKQKHPMELHLLEMYMIQPHVEEQTIYKFYNEKDVLVYKVELNFLDHPADIKLAKYLNESDLLIEKDNTKIHRLK